MRRTHEHTTDTFWSIVGGVEPTVDSITQVVTAVAQDPEVRRRVGMLEFGVYDRSLYDEARDIFVAETAMEYGLPLSESDRAYNLCTWMIEQEVEHGQA